MKIKDLGIGAQLRLGFAVLLVFVLLIVTVCYFQTVELHRQTETLYEHPLQVRRAIDTLTNKTLNMSLEMKNLMMAESEKEKRRAIELIELSKADVESQFSILRDRYLGPCEDIDESYHAYIRWKTSLDENVDLIFSDQVLRVNEKQWLDGPVEIKREQLIKSIQKIDDFAKHKADSLYFDSKKLENSLNKQLILIVVIVTILIFAIGTQIYKNVKDPLDELTQIARSVKDGNLDVRCSIDNNNEYGILSSSFNDMLETIEKNVLLNEKSTSLAKIMLSEDDAKSFFMLTLNELAKHTDSQVAAVYLLSDDKKTFQLFEAIGMDSDKRQSFDADSLEGEIGFAAASKKWKYIDEVSENTRFIFSAVSGIFVPRGIITIPILSNDEVIAIISLASITNFSRQALDFVDNVIDTMSARIEGILTYRLIKNMKDEMEEKNRELESQKSELTIQSAELNQQNKELEIQKQQLSEANQLKTNFLSNMSHELRTPLNSVIALSGVLNRRLAHQIPEEEHSYLEVIERSGKNLLTLINDILDISRIEAGRVDIEITKFNINSLISEVVTMIQPLANQKNIEILQKGKQIDTFIESDLDKCRHILQNIIGNAVKFTEKGQVKIDTVLKDSTVEIAVTDTGVGIEEEHLQNVFEEFRQADGSTSRRFGGTGLGLAIAKRYS
ncbi:MAG: ATP-binding protein, partial [Clostridia bacterium]|nr:ATP-binding protein [Clostridia bacterium]